jgi:hypothetical protein
VVRYGRPARGCAPIPAAAAGAPRGSRRAGTRRAGSGAAARADLAMRVSSKGRNSNGSRFAFPFIGLAPPARAGSLHRGRRRTTKGEPLFFDLAVA